MKGCLKFFLYGFLALAALSFGRYFFLLTPEQRAAEAQAYKDKQAAEEREAAEERAANQAKAAEIAEAKRPYLQELVKIPGVTAAEFTSDDKLIIRLAPELHVGEDHVRVMCESAAKGWAARVGLEHATCEEWYGAKRYALGEYNGPVPESYLAKIILEAGEKQQEKNRRALLAMEGKSLADIEGTHGPALTKNKETGWAEFRAFRARFENGKVVEVMTK